eukprot:scaffold46582_cov30-Phaeocystis_antarctica.AAC.1
MRVPRTHLCRGEGGREAQQGLDARRVAAECRELERAQAGVGAAGGIGPRLQQSLEERERSRPRREVQRRDPRAADGVDGGG